MAALRAVSALTSADSISARSMNPSLFESTRTKLLSTFCMKLVRVMVWAVGAGLPAVCATAAVATVVRRAVNNKR